jgi:CarD family transcriptional regulator
MLDILKTGDFVVFPSHGVGQFMGVEAHQVEEESLNLIVVAFEKDRMILRLPVSKAASAGLRLLTSPDQMSEALKTLKNRKKPRRMVWSRRAQEYEMKINSGDPFFLAEVVGELHPNMDRPDQSYSERQIYQSAFDRLARELAAVQKIDETEASRLLYSFLKAA